MPDHNTPIDLAAIYPLVVETTEQGIAIIRPNGEIAPVNESFCRQIGRSRADLLGKAMTSTLAPEGIAAFDERRQARQSGQLRQKYEVVFLHGGPGEKVYSTH